MNRIATTALGSLAALTALGVLAPVVHAASDEPTRPTPVVLQVAETDPTEGSTVRWQRDAGVVEQSDESGTVLISGTEEQLLSEGEAPAEAGWSEVDTAP